MFVLATPFISWLHAVISLDTFYTELVHFVRAETVLRNTYAPHGAGDPKCLTDCCSNLSLNTTKK